MLLKNDEAQLYHLFFNHWSFVIIFLIWSLNLIVYNLFWRFLGWTIKIDQIDHPESLKYLNNFYTLRFKIAAFTRAVSSESNDKICLEFVALNAENFTQITIPLYWITRHSILKREKGKPDVNVLFFHLNCSSPLSNFYALRIPPSSKLALNSINIMEIEIRQPFTDFKLAYINSSISKPLMAVLKSDEFFFLRSATPSNFFDFVNEIEKLNCIDCLLFTFFVSNMSIIFSLVAPLSLHSSEKIIQSIFYGQLPLLFGLVICYLCALIYSRIKINFSPYNKLNFYFLKDLYLIGINIISISFGAMATLFASRMSAANLRVWLTRILSNQISLFLFITSMFYLWPYLISITNEKWGIFKRESQETQSAPVTQRLEKPLQLTKVSMPKMPYKSSSSCSVQSTGSSYYEQLMAEGNIPQVKSISQYGTLLHV